MRPVIGILGGMGPRATVQFEQMLLDRLPGGDQAIPTIISLNDGSIPDRSQYLMGFGPNPGPRLQRNLRSLERLGATLVCLPCNTACAPRIFRQLRPATSRLINLPSEVVGRLEASGYRRVLLLATVGTVDSAVYQELCRDSGIECIVPDSTVQRLVMSVIAAVKRGELSIARNLARRVRAAVGRQNCEAVILGCTELPLVGPALVPDGVQAVDTLAVLADSCVRYTTMQAKGEVCGT